MTNPLYSALFAPLAQRPDAVLILPDGREITGRALHDQIARVAAGLRALGLKPGDRLAVQAAKTPQMLALYGAAVATGVVFLPLNTAYTAEELRYFTQDCAASALLVDPERQEALHDLAPRVESLGPGGSFDALCAGLPTDLTPVPRGPDDLAALLYTSGTTGRSKGAMMSHENLLSNARTLMGLWGFTSQDTLLHALPIYHTHGLFVACNVMLLARGRILYLPKFDLEAMITALPQATAMMGVPTFYTRLLNDPRLSRDLVGHMRLFISGSAPLLAETHAAWSARTGHAILERYGMTETNMLTSNPLDGPRRAGTVGLPLPDVSLRITDPETGATLPQGEIGMIDVRGPNVFKGYWQMPEKTAAEFRADGFFMTGDLGRIDTEGYVSIVGRAKDLIISGGFNIYPKEVEQVLDTLPGVAESAVIGLPHPDLGEAVFAVLAADGDGPDLDAIRAALETQLARFKQPRGYAVVAELPRNAMSKVQKAALRATYAGQFASG